MGTKPGVSQQATTKSSRKKLPTLKYLLKLVIVFAGYVAAGKLGLSVPFTSGNVSPIWPAAGVALAAVLLEGYGMWPGIAMGALAVNFFSPVPPISAFGMALGNTFSALFGGYLSGRFGRVQFRTPALLDVLKFIAVATLSPMVAATVGCASLYLLHTPAWSSVGTAWRVWWLGDAMGVLIVAPMFLAERRFPWPFKLSGLLEISFLTTGVVTTCLAIFGLWIGIGVKDDVLALLLFPFVIWAAVRFRVAGTTYTTLIIAAIAVWATAKGNGPFAGADALRNATLLQLFVAVISVTGLILAAVISERSRSEETVSERAKLLDLANDAILVRALDDTLTYWNRGAARLYGWTSEEVLGRPVLDILQTQFPKPISEIKAQTLREGSWEGELVHSQRNGNRIFVASRWALWTNNDGKPLGFLELNTNVTERKRAEESIRSLSARVLTMQDDERRRIARELHDSAGQTLVALALNIASLLEENETLGGKAEHVCRESLELIEGLTQELRTISYLLHPPLLDEAGLPAAIRWFAEGLSARTNIAVEVEIAPDFERMNPETETAIFRIIQEALTNVHRHSGSSSATVRLVQDAESIAVEVKDRGKGMPATETQSRTARIGVGIQGMRERVRQLGGRFEIKSGQQGTTIVAILPVSSTSPFVGHGRATT
jgi:PAS domain S-box-containing protein